VRSVAVLPFDAPGVADGGDVGGQGRPDARTADFAREQPAGGQPGVSDVFRVQPEAPLPGEQNIQWIATVQLGAMKRSLLVSRGMDDEPYERLLRPGARR